MNMHCASRLGWIRSSKEASPHALEEVTDPAQAGSAASGRTTGTMPSQRLADRTPRAPTPHRAKRSGLLLLATAALLLIPALAYADLLTVSVRSLEQTVVEGGTTGAPDSEKATFEVKLHGGTGSAAVKVTYALSGTATSGTDYTLPNPLTVEIPNDGSTTATIEITTIAEDPGVLEGDETLTVTLTHASTTMGTVRLGTPTEATTTIVDSGGVTVQVTADDDLQDDSATVDEGDAQTFTVRLSGAVSTDVTVGYETADGTAKAGTDYVAAESPATVVIAAGELMGKITVDTVEDTLAGEDETFTLMLTLSDPPANVTLRRATAEATINDDDILRASLVGPDRVAEGKAATYTVTLSGATSSADVVLRYTVGGGDAEEGDDYEAPSGTLTIPRGRASGTIVVQTIADGQDDETFIVTLSEPTEQTTTGTVTLATASHMTTISAAGTVTVSVAAAAATVNEGDGARFTLTLSERATSDVDVDYSTTGLSPQVTGTVRITGTSATFTVDTPEDTQAEADQTFTVTLTSATGSVKLGRSTAEVTIRDDDPLTMSVRSLEQTVVEGGTGPADSEKATFEVKLDGGTGSAAVTVTYALSGTATGGADYEQPDPLTVVIPIEMTTATIEITTIAEDPGVLEGDETLTLTLTHASTTAGTVRLGTPTTASTTIGDSDATVTVDVAAEPATVNEGEAQTFTVTLSGSVSMDVVVGYATANGSATTADYSGSASGTVTIPAGETEGTIVIPTTEDVLAEDPETFMVTLSGSDLPANVTLRHGTAEATIQDDDPLEARVFGPDYVAEGKAATYTVTLSGATSSANVVLDYTVSGDADENDDYQAPSGKLTIARGRASGTIVIQTITDDVSDDDEPFTVTLSEPTEQTTTGTVRLEKASHRTMISAAGTVTVAVRAAAATVNEGDGARFTLTLSERATSDVDVDYSTTGLSPQVTGTVRITGTSATFTVDTPEDTQAEADQTFTVTLTSATGSVKLGRSTAEVTIRDDDPLTVSVRSLEQTVVEGGTTGAPDSEKATFEVKLDGGTGSAAVTVTYALSGTATGGADYEQPDPLTVVIPIEMTTATIEITTIAEDPGVLEGDETLTLTLTHASTTAGTVRLGTPTTASTTIGDSDATVTVDVAAEPATVNEGEAQTFTVTLSGSVSMDVVVGYATANGSATTADYSGSASGTVTIPAGETEGTIVIPTTEDVLAEDPETFMVTLSGSDLPANVTLRHGTAEATIQDDDPLEARVFGPDYVAEGKAATYTVTLSGATSSANVVLDYTVSGDADENDDYQAPSGKLTIARGRASGTIVIQTITDDVSDDDEPFTVTLSEPTEQTTTGTVRLEKASHRTMISAAGTVTVAVRAAAATVNEGDGARFTLTLSERATSDVDVDYSTTGLSPQVTGTVRITGTSATFTVDTPEDTQAEADQTFTVTLTSATGSVKLGRSTAEVTIRDDDPLTVSVRSLEQTVVEGGTGPADSEKATFEVKLDGGTGSAAVTVTYALSGTATGGADYEQPDPLTVVIPIEMTTATIEITTIAEDPGVLEGDETLTLTLTHASTTAGTVRLGTPTTASTTIGDSDATVTVDVAAEPATVNEGEAQTFTVTLSGLVSEDVIVAFATMDGSATAGADYTKEVATLVIAAGDSVGAITIDTFEDTLEEGDETFKVTVTLSSAPPNVRPGEATATASIRDGNTLIARLSGPMNVPEGKPATFTVELDGGTGSEAVLLNYMWEGEATEDDDYEAPSGTLTIPRGAATANIVIRTKADDELEADETLIVSLDQDGASTSAGTVTVGTQRQHIMTIKPADTVLLSVSDVTVFEGDPAIFTVTMSEPVSEAVMVSFETANVTGSANEADYTAVSASLVIPVGQTTAAFTVDTVEDTKAEDSETFTVTLTLERGPSNVAYGKRTATATISDDTLSVSIEGPAAIVEGEDAEYIVTLAGSFGEDAVVVTYTVTGTATSGEDYTPPSETLTVPAGATTGTIVISTQPDGVLEGEETLVVTLVDATTGMRAAAVASPATVLTTIEDSDGTVTVSVTDSEIVVEADPAIFTVTLSSRVSEDVSLRYATSDDGTATAGEDYTAASEAVVVPAGQTTATFTVATLADDDDEAVEETFTVNLTEDPGRPLPEGVRLAGATASGKITDYALTASVTGPANVAEGSPATFTVSLDTDGDPRGNRTDVVVTYTTIGSSAEPSTDFAAPSGTLTIPANSLIGTIEIATRTDNLLDHETLVIRLSDATAEAGLATVGTPDTVTTRIVDGGMVDWTVADITVGEDELAIFTVNLSDLVQDDVTLTYSTRDGTAMAGSDYTAVRNGTVTVTGGRSSASFTVATIDDTQGESNEDFTVELRMSGAIAGVGPQSDTATAEIRDDDIVLRPVDAVTITEGETGTITLSLEQALRAPVKVGYMPGEGTSLTVTEEDYSIISLPPGVTPDAQGALTLPVNFQSGDITVLAVDDSLAEGTEQLILLLMTVPPSGQGATLGTIQIIIEDNDELSASVSVPETVTEGEVARFTVSLGGGESTAPVVVSYSVGGTAKAPGDYTDPSGSLTVPSGESSGTISIRTNTDNVIEPDETLVVTLTNAETANGTAQVGSPSSATTAIQDEAFHSFNRVNQTLLPGVVRASAASALEAVSWRMAEASQGDPPAASADLAGLTGLYRALQANERALQDGSYDLAKVLGGSSFLVPLSSHDGDSGSQVGVAVWGGGDFRSIGGGEENTVDWDGSVWSARLGADLRFVDSLLTGIAVSWASGALDYVDATPRDDREGTYATWLMSAHPYVGWTTPDFGLWASGGFGFGGVTLDDSEEDAQEADLTQWSVGAGGSVTLLSTDWFIAGGTTAVKLKAEGFLAGATVAENESKLIQELTVGVNQARAAIEASHAQHFAGGGSLRPSLEIGGRFDGGDGETGAGLEVGGGLTYADPGSGLTVAGIGRALVVRDGNYGEWGLSGLIQLDPNAAGHGLMMSVRPTFGVTASGVSGLWEHGTLDLLSSGEAAGGRVEAEIGYGLAAFGTAGVLTPYAGASLTDAGAHSLSLGGRLELGPAFDLTLELERSDSADPDTAAEHDITLEGSFSW